MATTTARIALVLGAFAGAMALSSLIAPGANALKYAAREHNIQPDKAIPVWVPGPVTLQPEEELSIAGADPPLWPETPQWHRMVL